MKTLLLLTACLSYAWYHLSLYMMTTGYFFVFFLVSLPFVVVVTGKLCKAIHYSQEN